MAPKRTHLYLTLADRIIAEFWIDTNQDGGLCFGPAIPNSDVHLTAFQRNGKARYHITHKGIKEPTDESPIGRQTSTKIIAERMGKMLENRLKTYHGNLKCYVFTQSRWKKTQEFMPKIDEKRNMQISMELFVSELDMDFSNLNLWKKVPIRSLINSEPNFGYIVLERGVRIVFPVSKNLMLAWPLSKQNEIQEYASEVFGICVRFRNN